MQSLRIHVFLIAVFALARSVNAAESLPRTDYSPSLPFRNVFFCAHDGPVRCIQFSPNGQVLASSGEDGVIITRKMDDVRQKLNKNVHLRGHSKAIPQIAFSPDSTTIASVSLDGTLRLWNGNVREASIAKPLTSVVFSPDGKTVWAAGHVSTLYEFDVETLKRTDHVIEADRNAQHVITHLVFLPPDNHKLLLTTNTGKVLVKELATPKIDALERGRPFAHHASVLSDGTILAVSLNNSFSLKYSEGPVKNAPLQKLVNLPNPIRGVALSPIKLDQRFGHLLALASGDTVSFWDCATGKKITGAEEKTLQITNVVFSANAEMIATTRDTGIVGVWNVKMLLENIPGKKKK